MRNFGFSVAAGLLAETSGLGVDAATGLLGDASGLGADAAAGLLADASGLGADTVAGLLDADAGLGADTDAGLLAVLGLTGSSAPRSSISPSRSANGSSVVSLVGKPSMPSPARACYLAPAIDAGLPEP